MTTEERDPLLDHIERTGEVKDPPKVPADDDKPAEPAEDN